METVRLQELLLRGLIAEMPESQRLEVEKAVKELAEFLQRHGQAGVAAVALKGAELSAE